MTQIKNIGLIGFGVVGEGVYHVINSTPGLKVNIKKIGIRHADKIRNAPKELFTTGVNSILYDEDIDTIVELIDDAEKAYEMVKLAIQNGKNVVTANKKMLAAHLPELINLQRKFQVSLLYEAAVCGSIPILRNLEEYYNNDLLQSIRGVVNGSTNFILTQMVQQQISYEHALKQAQESGFAESDPALDVEGFDAQNKLTLLLKHTFGASIAPETIFRKGITSLNAADLQYAREKDFKVKLIAKAFYLELGEIAAYVMPQFVTPDDQLYAVNNEYNAILIGSLLADEQFLYGKGAGRYPTASAVLSDISALNYQYRYEYKKSDQNVKIILSQSAMINVYIGWEKGVVFDKKIMQEINTEFTGERYCFLTGKISLHNLFSLSGRKDISLIELPQQANHSIALQPLGLAKTLCTEDV